MVGLTELSQLLPLIRTQLVYLPSPQHQVKSQIKSHGLGIRSMVQCLHCTHEVLSLLLSTTTPHTHTNGGDLDLSPTQS